MKDFKDRVAVVTGGASGIGLAMARRFAAEGMRVVLADIEEAALAGAVRQLTDAGAGALGVRTDVAVAADVEALAAKAESAYGATHVLCNNAGVAVGGKTWELTEADWQWVLGVNLWGVIHGVRSFVPRMLARGGDGHVVNTASVAGLTSGPFITPYYATKHAVVALSESLHHEFALTGAPLRVSVLCPGFVKTRIGESARNRPAAPAAPGAPAAPRDPGVAAIDHAFQALIAGGVPPDVVAGRVLDAIRDERFWVLTHPELTPAVAVRMKGILDEKNPTFDPASLTPR